MLSVAWLSCTAAVARPVAGVAGVAGVIPLPAASSLMRKVHPPRCNLKMQYGGGGGGSFDQQGYSYGAQQEEYAAQQNYGTQPNFGAEVVWTLHGSPGVKGFFDVAGFTSVQAMSLGVLPTPMEVELALNINQQVKSMAADVSAMGGSAASVYEQDYRYLPYTLRNGQMQVLSRWNMVNEKLTVSRVQCKVRVSSDGTATLRSCGKGPTLWRAWGGPWNVLHKDERHILSDGDQVSLDWQDPEAAVFTCQVQAAMQQGGYEQQGYAQQGNGQSGYTQQGFPNQRLPAGWTAGVDPSSGGTYYYNEQTGQSQWEPPTEPPMQQGGY